MSDQALVFKMKRMLQIAESQMRQLEALCLAQKGIIEDLQSIGCAWAFSQGAGFPSLTDDEVSACLIYRHELTDAERSRVDFLYSGTQNLHMAVDTVKMERRPEAQGGKRLVTL